MKAIKKENILFFVLILLSACHNNLIDKDYDDKITKDFIKQLIESQEKLYQERSFIHSNCILEQPEWTLIDNEFTSIIQKELKIENKTFLEFQIDLLNDFKIVKELTPNKKIITDLEYNKFNESFKENEFAYIDWLDEMSCKEGFSSISKPIFNEKYNLAVIRYEKVCGPLCGGGVIAIYELIKGKWQQKKIIDNWIY
ncbi:hypothetical protein [uncultured Tenacibaculum sp.]|uniref:hypothetical protein n=1 Tax=uncultured Tenacibaculum sp. TaxID=174713 RepID=UPI0010438D36|nr:hypothetical protein [uncultured Tenacibaculum sp.]TCI90960.1 hypothetical protein EYW44_11445 [Tenacibaculum sp. M341]